MLSITLLITLVCLYICYKWNRYLFSYWKTRGIPDLNPKIPFGDLEYPWKATPGHVQSAKIYNVLRNRNHKHGGIFAFLMPIYIPVDPEYVKNIMTKDFQYFTSRGLYPTENILQNLFTQQVHEWQTMRQKLSLIFTSGKMKNMFDTMLACTDPLINEVERLTANDQMIDIKDVALKYMTDVIGSCAFGIECNSFKTKYSNIQKYGGMVFEESLSKRLRVFLLFTFRRLSRKLRITFLEKEATTFFTKLLTEIYNYRKKNNVQRKDMLQLLIELEENNIEPKLTLEDIIAQSYAFLVGGFHTTSGLMALCLFELAINCDIQDRLREEIRNTLSQYNGEIGYTALKDMKYMDQVINETMRKYPIVPFISRECMKPYKIPFTATVLEEGTFVLISILGLHRDPILFPDPEKFDPERFSEANKKNIIPGSYIPFGNGPKICIGMRFGIIQTKLYLVTLLKNFEFTLNSKTKMPLELDFKLIATAKGGIWLNSKKIV